MFLECVDEMSTRWFGFAESEERGTRRVDLRESLWIPNNLITCDL
jgi:hypothetical protein